MTGLKDCKSCQENVSLFRAKGKLDEKNEWKFSNQTCEVIYASIYLTNCRKSFFYSIPYLEYDFMTANSQIKFSCFENIGDVLGTYQWLSALLVKLQAFISQFN